MSLYDIKRELDDVLAKAAKADAYDRMRQNALAIRAELEAMYEQQPLAIRQAQFWTDLYDMVGPKSDAGEKPA